MSTAGLFAFDAKSREIIERLARKPFDRFGSPIFCKSCTDRVGVGYTERCPRQGTSSAHLCPFREVLLAKPETEDAS
jgi:hypothetical protein